MKKISLVTFILFVVVTAVLIGCKKQVVTPTVSETPKTPSASLTSVQETTPQQGITPSVPEVLQAEESGGTSTTPEVTQPEQPPVSSVTEAPQTTQEVAPSTTELSQEKSAE